MPSAGDRAESGAAPRPSSAVTRRVDFRRPLGEPALISADSVSWRVFKNPIAAFIGGVAAVILELAEPRVRAGVWDHTTFRTQPLQRLRRTGLAAMVTVYGASSVAEPMIAGVRRMHARVQGVTDDQTAYQANDQELLDWVQATASFGFVQAYSHFVRTLGDEEFDRFYAESATPARLYGAVGAPLSSAMLETQFQAMRPKLRRSEVVFEFLDIMQRTVILPWPLRPFQRMLVRAAVEITPPWAREILDLGPARALRPWELRLVRLAGRLSDRYGIPGTPPVQACQRLGLPRNYLYQRRG